ncbi:MAG: hypothetical protein IKT38_03245 [Clostridia bacterium]|nr:hypothetical protein [Clostridia bacterium]
MDKFKNLVTYAWLVFAVYATGSIFFVSFNYKLYITMLFAVSFVFFLISNEFRVSMLRQDIIRVLFLFICILFVLLLNGVTAYSSYIAIFLQIVAAYFISNSISRAEFEKKYINIISFFAAVSLVCHCVFLISPSIALNFPMTIGDGSTNYYNAYIHVFQSAQGYSSYVPFKRNAGIFWEPGAYQAFLNLGLFFILAKEEQLTKKEVVKIILLIMAIITTYSTTGYIIMAILLLRYAGSLCKFLAKHSNIAIVVGVVFLVFMIIISKYGLSSFMSQKLENEFSDGVFLNRLFLDDINIILEKPLNFLGISFERYARISGGSGNSIIHTMVNLGIPFTFTMLLMYFKYSTLKKNPILCFVILMMIFSTESLMWRPIFLCLAWYGSKT